MLAAGFTDDLAEEGADGVTGWVIENSVWVVDQVYGRLNSTATPTVNGDLRDGDWFAGQYQMMMNIGWWVMLPLIFLMFLHSIMRGSMQLLIRSIGMYLPLAMLGTVVATQIIQLLINIVDDMCKVFVDMTAYDMRQFLFGLRESMLNLGGAGTWVISLFVMALLLIVCAFLTMMFILRDASVYLAVMFLPIGFAMMVWPMAARYFRKMVEFLVGVILSKLVMVVIISLSVSALAGTTTETTAGNTLLYPDGSAFAGSTSPIESTAPTDPGVARQPVTSPQFIEDPDELGANSLWKTFGYVLSAITMLMLAAVSPAMTVRLVGNMGLQEMAGNAADAVERAGLIYQGIGGDRMTTIFVTNPRNLGRAITGRPKIPGSGSGVGVPRP
jgi:hypothetical protein